MKFLFHSVVLIQFDQTNRLLLIGVYLSHNVTNDITVIQLSASATQYTIDVTQGVYYFTVLGENIVGNGSINSTIISHLHNYKELCFHWLSFPM